MAPSVSSETQLTRVECTWRFSCRALDRVIGPFIVCIEVMSSSLLPMTDLMHVVIGREVVKLTRQSSHVILKTLLHIVQSGHDRISDISLNVIAKFRILRVERIPVTVKTRLHVIQALIHMCHHSLKSGIMWV
jgi:hypothetical protein